MEGNREKFIRLAESRVNNTIKNIRLIGNLSNKSNYSYTQKDIDKMFNTLLQELKKSKSRFSKADDEDTNSFKFDK